MCNLTGYMKTVKNKLKEKGASEETIAEFEKGAQKYVKEKLIPNFKDFEFFTGESMDVDGMYVLRYPPISPSTVYSYVTLVWELLN